MAELGRMGCSGSQISLAHVVSRAGVHVSFIARTKQGWITYLRIVIRILLLVVVVVREIVVFMEL